ncbi:GNAT family N-acetyltransferase [Paenibacillus filicis]|uniref:GNAT family N-acetyltransferase n=1 Tax=Paenibacillus filicis TaxID=669464 RepID=A0ABU9DU85_9BACL
MIELRALLLPDDYEAIAALLNQVGAEPTSAEKLLEEDGKLYEKGHTWIDENGRLAGYDRERRVAVTEAGEIIGFAISWRAPWTEPGHLCNTLVVDSRYRGQGIGDLLLAHVAQWASKSGASRMLSEAWDDDPAAVAFAERKGFSIDRHTFQSLLQLEGADLPPAALQLPESLEGEGIRFLTLADESGEDSETKLYELYRETLVDIPGFLGDVPNQTEWRKWYLQVHGYAPEQVIIAAEGDRFAGVTNVLYHPVTNGMYHEYTGVSRDFRGRKVALGLKIQAIRMAIARGAAYLRTDNDSMNEPILSINRKLGYVPLRGHYRLHADLDQVLASVRGRVENTEAGPTTAGLG